ncbi:UNKNOWN [Stylonychia lemnae]|uniref:Uncharacterized protein n=1 Tax=Stylonychia lemnae TaxID=5949 RepID=A0A077ZPL6_STYLE|nr:UNKNOWN [Stylonychia lemnae]|eukprot:CDW71310.1 UNKNOWN [Stylonychia lemnae]
MIQYTAIRKLSYKDQVKQYQQRGENWLRQHLSSRLMHRGNTGVENKSDYNSRQSNKPSSLQRESITPNSKQNDSSTHHILRTNDYSQSRSAAHQQNGIILQDKIMNLKSALSNIKNNINVFKTRQTTSASPINSHDIKNNTLRIKQSHLNATIAGENTIEPYNKYRMDGYSQGSIERQNTISGNNSYVNTQLTTNLFNKSYDQTQNFQQNSMESAINLFDNSPLQRNNQISNSISRQGNPSANNMNDRSFNKQDNYQHQIKQHTPIQSQNKTHLYNRFDQNYNEDRSHSDDTLKQVTDKMTQMNYKGERLLQQVKQVQNNQQAPTFNQNSMMNIHVLNKNDLSRQRDDSLSNQQMHAQSFKREFRNIKLDESNLHSNRENDKQYQRWDNDKNMNDTEKLINLQGAEVDVSISKRDSSHSDFTNKVQEFVNQSLIQEDDQQTFHNQNNSNFVNNYIDDGQRQYDNIKRPTKSSNSFYDSKGETEKKELYKKISSLETENLILENQIQDINQRLENQLRKDGVQQSEIKQLEQKINDQERDINLLRSDKLDLIDQFKRLENDREQLNKTYQSMENKHHRKEIYLSGLERQVQKLKEEIHLQKYVHKNKEGENLMLLRMKESENQLERLRQDALQMRNIIIDKDRIINEYENKVNELMNQNQLQMQTYNELAKQITTPGFSFTEKEHNRRSSFRNKSVDYSGLNGSFEGQINQSVSGYIKKHQTISNHDASNSSAQAFNVVQDILKLMGCNTFQDLIHKQKSMAKEKKFCHKVIKLVRDVEGKKPDSLKNCWQWIKGLLQDFVNLKKSAHDQTRVLKKIELCFSAQNQHAYTQNMNTSQLMNLAEQNDYISGYNTRDFNLNQAGIFSGGSIEKSNSNYYQAPSSTYTPTSNSNVNILDIYSGKELNTLETAIDNKLRTFRKYQ